jgi:uncharacterized protein
MQTDNFEWDDAKAASNFVKHGIPFEMATFAFDDPDALDDIDESANYGEHRHKLIGDVEGSLVVVIYVLRGRRTGSSQPGRPTDMSEKITSPIDTLENLEAGATWRRLPHTFGIRRRLKLTIEEFAERFQIPSDLVTAWEDGRATPDAAAETYLRVIAHDPEHVAKVLQAGVVSRRAAE